MVFSKYIPESESLILVVLKDCRIWEKIESGTEFQYLEIIGITMLVNSFVRFIFKLTAKEYCKFKNPVFRVNVTLERIIELFSLGRR